MHWIMKTCQLYAPSTLRPQKETSVISVQDGGKKRSAHCEEGKTHLDIQGVELRFLGRPARNLVAIL